MTQVENTQDSPVREPNLAALLGKRRHVILLCMLITLAVVLVVTFIRPPMYESTSRILIEPQIEDNPYFIEKITPPDQRRFIETHKEILLSDSVVIKTIAALRNKPEDQIHGTEIKKFLRDIEVTTRKSMGKNIFQGNGIGESNVIFVIARASKPDKAAKVCNTLVDNYLKAVSRIRFDQAKAAISILESTVAEADKKLKDCLNRLSAFEMKVGPILPELLAMDKNNLRLFPELVTIRSEYEQQKAEIVKKKEIIAVLEKSLEPNGAPGIVPEAFALNPNLNNIKSGLFQLYFKKINLKTLYMEESREVKNINEQIQKAEGILRYEIQLTMEGEKDSLAVMEKAQKEREKVLSDYDEKMKQLSRYNSQYAGLREEYHRTSDAYGKQVEKLAEASMAAAERSARAANIAIIDRAIPNSRSMKFGWVVNIIIALILGLGIGIFIVLLEFMISPAAPENAEPRRVSSKED